MSYSLFIEEKCKKRIEKATSKNSEFKKALENKIKHILENPYDFKPLRKPLQNKRRVHILKSFVLIYDIIEETKTVRLLEINHHDNIYKGAIL